jgi:phosphoribosylformylglycinamidine synthase
VRAGAIFAARLKSRLGGEITEFISSGRPVVGVCNGFQILVELGALPGFRGVSEKPEAVLAINKNNRFQCRPVYLKHERACKITSTMKPGAVLQVPVAHAEGRLTFGVGDKTALKELIDCGQIVFRYCTAEGREAKGVFPLNPNGSLYDIAGICNPDGNVLGMMPHPERVMEFFQHADWTRKKRTCGEGRAFFESLANYMRRN